MSLKRKKLLRMRTVKAMNNNRIKLYIADQNSHFIDQIEGVFFERPELRIDVIGSTTKTADFSVDPRIKKADIFLLSANLPDGTGLKLVDILKSNPECASIPIIFTIDKQTRNAAPQAQEKGVDEIFQKPLQLTKLIDTIHSLTAKANQMQPAQQEEEDFFSDWKPGQPVEKVEAPREDNFLNDLNTQSTDFMNSFFSNEPNKTQEGYKQTPTFNEETHSADIFKKIDNNPLLNTKEHVVQETKYQAPAVKTIITFTSVSSTGKTSVLVNTAYAIRKYARSNPSICIVDLNLLFPCASFHFSRNEVIHARKDIYDLCADLNYLNEDLLKEALHYHQPSGIHILNTPSEPEFLHQVSSIKAEQIERLIVHLRDIFDVILIDTSTTVTDDLVLCPMQLSDKNIIVLEPNYLNVMNVNKFFYVLEKLEDSLKEDIIKKTHIILNRESYDKSIHSDTTRNFLKNKEFIVTIPEDNTFLAYSNKGKFIVDSPDSIASKPITDLANFLYPIEPQTNQQDKKKFNIANAIDRAPELLRRVIRR